MKTVAGLASILIFVGASSAARAQPGPEERRERQVEHERRQERRDEHAVRKEERRDMVHEAHPGPMYRARMAPPEMRHEVRPRAPTRDTCGLVATGGGKEAGTCGSVDAGKCRPAQGRFGLRDGG